MTQEIQNFELKPMLVGADVISLYPNLDGIAISKMVGNAIRNTKVTFNGINYLFLCVYIFLVLGGEEMDRVGLGECKPKRRKKSEARSLASTMNRDLDHWNFENIKFTEKKKKEMVALMAEIAVLTLISTTCYTFDGRIYRQIKGLGIGLSFGQFQRKLTVLQGKMAYYLRVSTDSERELKNSLLDVNL